MFVDVEGVSIYAQLKGEARKSLVLLHGWGFNSRMWKLQLPTLIKHYTVAAIDLRGFGMSHKPRVGYTYETWMRDLKVLIETLDLNDITLAGYSLGGALAMLYAAEADTIDRLILISAAGPRMMWSWENRCGLPEAFWRFFIPIVKYEPFTRMFDAWYTIFFPRNDDSRWLNWISGMFKMASRAALVGALYELAYSDFTALLSHIDVPTKILHGRFDEVVPFGLAKVQLREIPDATLTTFWRSDHGIFFAEPSKLAAELV